MPVDHRERAFEEAIDASAARKVCRRKLIKRIDPRTLHDFRTSLRRIEAVLRLEKHLLEKRRFEHEIEQIKYLQGLTGPLRESHVSSKILRSEGFSKKRQATSGSARRRKKEGAFQAILVNKAFDLFFSDIAMVFQEIERKMKRSKLQKKVEASFCKEMERVQKSISNYDQGGPKRKVLHHLRIQAKRLRYDLELFDFLHPPKRKKLLKATNEVQYALGQLRDWQGVEKSFERLGITAEGKKGGFEILERKEWRLLRRARKAIRYLEGMLE